MNSPSSKNDKFFRNTTFGSAIAVLFVLLIDPQPWIGLIDPQPWIGGNPGIYNFFIYLILIVGPALLAVFISLTFVNFEARIWLLLLTGLWFIYLNVMGRAQGDLKLPSGIIITLASMWFVVAPIWLYTTRRLP
jgi:hypothetical protein